MNRSRGLRGGLISFDYGPDFPWKLKMAMLRCFQFILILVLGLSVRAQEANTSGISPKINALVIWAQSSDLAQDEEALKKEIFAETGLSPELLSLKTVAVDQNDPLFRQKLKQKLKRALTKDTVFQALVIAVPGVTKLEAGGNYISQLQGIGEISEGGVDSEFADIMGSLKGKIAGDGNIVFAGCSEFCGTNEQIKARSLQLLQFFAMNNGAVSVMGSDSKFAGESAPGKPVLKTAASPGEVLRPWIRAASFVVIMGAMVNFDSSVWGLSIGAGLANWSSGKISNQIVKLRDFDFSKIKAWTLRLKNSRVSEFIQEKALIVLHSIQNRVYQSQAYRGNRCSRVF